MTVGVATQPDRAEVRLAELVGALSLGIDLGFGQPMEHVLRQCLIALRVAERLGLDEEHRAVVYYTALLVNVGCHADAHEQAKWFGDDIALKAIKYDHEPRSLRMAASSMRFLGSGHPPLHRFRLGLEFVISGHREVDGMIAHHAALALGLPGERFDRALLAIADFVDLKSPYFLGHARAVAELAGEAGAQLGLPEDEVRLLRRAGLVHDLGRLGVSNAIWDKRGPLGAGEWERLRLQPYLTERMLRQSPALAPLARIAVQHRERLDGSGYPQGLSGTAIAPLARVLGAADAYQAMREPRPHRAPRSADDAAKELRADVRAGR